MNTEERPGDSPPEEEAITLEAYPAHERVKAEILNRHTAANENLCGFMLYSVNRDKKHPKRLSQEAIVYWRQFQVSVLALYKFLKPNIRNSRKYEKEYKDLEKLDTCFTGMLRSDKVLKKEDWVHLHDLLDKFVYDLGITKIEFDKREMDDIF